MKQTSSIKIIALIVASYMLLAIGWWTVLLLNKNEQLKEAQNILDQKNIASNIITIEKFNSQRVMIMGEGIAFCLALILGIYLLYRVFRKELLIEKSKANFQMSITHELKTPVTAIKLTLDTLKRKLSLNSELQEVHLQGSKAASRLDNLINKFLVINQLDGNYSYEKEPILVVDLIAERVAFFKKMYPDFQISISNDSMHEKIMFDRESFISVLDNIIENAYKYSNERKKKLDITVQSLNKYFLLNFKDYGVGIEEKYRKVVFNKYFRIGDEMTRFKKGTGLGLYIVGKILDDHQVKYEIKQHENHGINFEIKIPII